MILKLLPTFFKEFIQSWKESLYLFGDKRFWLINLKSIKETYIILIRKFWWLIGICVMVDLFIKSPMLPSFFKNSFLKHDYLTIGYSIWFLLWSLLGLVTFLAVRPSVDKKDYVYFSNYIRSYFAYFVAITGIVWFLSALLTSFLILANATIFGWLLFLLPSFFGIITFSTIYFAPFIIMYTFFYLDSDKNIITLIKRLFSALLLLLYTYPFCLIMWFLVVNGGFFVSVYLTKALMLFVQSDGFTIFIDLFSKLFLPAWFCIINNLYLKQVHEHFERYES